MKILKIAITLFVILLAAGCAGQADQAAKSEPIKIGVSSALTGDVAGISLPSKYAIELALEDWNSDPNNQKFEIIYEDNLGKGANAVTAFQKLVDLDKVAAVITDTTTAVMSIGPKADEMKIPVIAYLTTSPVASGAGDFVFRTSPVNIPGMELLAERIIQEGVTEVGVIAQLNDYTVSLKDAFSAKYQSLGGSVLAVELFDETMDLRTEITKVSSKNPDAIIVLSVFPKAGAEVLQQIKELGITIPIYANEVTGCQQSLNAVGPEVMEGLTIVSPLYSVEKLAELKSRYIAKVGNENIFDWLYVGAGYDAAMIYFNAISEVGTDSEAIKAYLYSLKSYDGVSGQVTFDANGDRTGVEYALFKYQNGERVKI